MCKRIIVPAVVTALMCTAGVRAQTTSGTISGTETWSGTVTLTGDVIVEGSLTIDPGTTVRFATTNDNIVSGASDKIYLVVMPGGVLQANGTADNRIKFTTSSLFPASGSWGKINVIANGGKSQVSYCDFEYHDNVVAVEKPTGVTGTSNFTLRNCTFSNGGTCVFASDGDSVTIDSCFFSQNVHGVFHHGAGYVGILNSVVHRAAAGLICAGKEDYTTVAEIDHVTMYDIDLSIAGSSSSWWDGYGVFCTNNAYTLTLTNSILYQSTLANLIANDWTVVESHNCFHTGLMGLANYEDGTVNTAGGSFEGDPLFENAPASFELSASSPCVGTAGDGGNMGAPAGVATAGISGGTGSPPLDATLLANPVTDVVAFRLGNPGGARLDIFTLNGDAVASVTSSGSLVSCGVPGLEPGAYQYMVTAGASVRQGTFIITK